MPRKKLTPYHNWADSNRFINELIDLLIKHKMIKLAKGNDPG